MAKRTLGKVGFVDRGIYSSTEAYSRFDFVYIEGVEGNHESGTYLCIIDEGVFISNRSPFIYRSSWKLLAKGGIDGRDGRDGRDGVDGVGVVVNLPATYGFMIRDGDLIVSYPDEEEPPNFYINEQGDLILSTEPRIPSYYVLGTDADFFDGQDGPYYTGSHEYIIIPQTLFGSPVLHANLMFENNSTIKGVASEGGIESFASAFFEADSISQLDLRFLDTKSATSFASMFTYCQDLVSIDLSTFDTSNVKTMQNMFQGCGSLVTLDLSSFSMYHVQNVDNMFTGCINLQTVYVRNNLDKTTMENSIGVPSGVNFIIK